MSGTLLDVTGIETFYGPIQAIRGVSLQVEQGQIVTVLGANGAGKTTLVNLLPRFYEVTSGAIRVDGIDARNVTIRSLREQVAMVTQENILFHDTVWNNICYGMTNVSKERVLSAAQAALAHDFIQELPQKYGTVIGERGTRLSGGQRQRLADLDRLAGRRLGKNRPRRGQGGEAADARPADQHLHLRTSTGRGRASYHHEYSTTLAVLS